MRRRRRHRLTAVAIVVLGAVGGSLLSLSDGVNGAGAARQRIAAAHPLRPLTTYLPSTLPTSVPTPTPTPRPTPVPTPWPAVIAATAGAAPPRFAALTTDLAAFVEKTGHVSISLAEVGGRAPQMWSVNGDDAWEAASTYKLPLLMTEAQLIAQNKAAGSDQICFQSSDLQDGPFRDYHVGACFTRDELGRRVGQYSDNTAAWMLMRTLGGGYAINSNAAAWGAKNSDFWWPNTTTADDLTALWFTEAKGKSGGTSAQNWLYPRLTKTIYEQGIPGGVPQSVTVIHKIGFLNGAVNDTALVLSPRGAYVLTVLTKDVPDAWHVIAAVSARIWKYEVARAR